MMQRNSQDGKPLCLALGLGAIGKSVSGYAMTKAGVHVTFADIVDAQIRAVNEAGGYWLGTADIHTKKMTRSFITGVDAVRVDSDAAQTAALQAEYLISAVGPKGFRALLPRMVGWMQARNAASPAPLYFMVFENDQSAVPLLTEALKEAFGAIPAWLHITKCSIERMTKVTQDPEVGSMAVGETFIPVIAGRAAMEGCSIRDRSDVLELVDDVSKYYCRKLLTTNLGHAVMAFSGDPKGYTNTLEAIADPEIRSLLEETLGESSRVLCLNWGFDEEKMRQHVETLLLRYANPGLVDDLSRLSRDPIRKLSPDERIVLPTRLCYQYGIRPAGLLKTLHAALHFSDPDVEGGQKLIDLRDQIGAEGILRTVCKADGAFLEDALRIERVNSATV